MSKINGDHRLRPTRVLITGAAGFVGSHLAERCVDRGLDVLGIDCFTDYYEPAIKRRNLATLDGHSSWRFLEADLREVELAPILEDIDVVFHLAAQPGVRASWGETFQTYVDCNVVAMQRVLEAAKSASLKRFVVASSSAVDGDAGGL